MEPGLQIPSIPTGTLTFLFSDIQGSTRQWERNPAAMSQALARHDELLREGIESHGGYVFKTVGDAFCAAFPTAIEALRATVACQRLIVAEVWPEPIRMKIRMAIHTGAAESRQGDYFGQPLNRVARLLSAGHGGQILLSLATQELVRDNLPPGVSLKEIGERRLKDLVRPEQVFQVVCYDLDDDFPELKTLDIVSNNLPIQLTSFVGREREMEEVRGLLESSRLVTLTGSGGAGKTRLALQVAADVIENFSDGAWLVELAALTEPAQVLRTITQSLGIHEESGRPLIDVLVESIRAKRTLLILDNCEHLLDACAETSELLLRAVPDLRILTTSREPLGIAGERTYRVPSLGLPPQISVGPNPHTPGEVAFTAADLNQYEAVRLFIDRAVLSSPSFVVTNESAPALAQLCTRLDGIPLALELAAARCRALSVQEIYARLDDRFRLLTGGSRTALPRQKTLRALVDWSYDLLSEPERMLLMRLSVFSNGWTIEAAESVCLQVSGEDEDVLDLIMSLVDKSLVIADSGQVGTRYRLLQTVRDYALDRLLVTGGVEQVRSAHRDFFYGLTVSAAGHLRGIDQKSWLDRLESEHDNLRAAIQWSVMQGDMEEKGLQMCSNLYYFWWIRGHLSEGKSWHQQLLQVTSGRHSIARGNALQTGGNFALYQGDYATAKELFEQSLDVCQGLGSAFDIAVSLHNLAHVAHLKGDLAEAKPLYEQSLTIRRELNDQNGMTATLNNLANVAQDLGDFGGARAMHEEALAVRRSLGGDQAIAQTLQNLGNLATELRDFASSRRYYHETLTLTRELRDIRSLYQTLHGFAELASQTGKPVAAANLWGSAEALRESIGIPIYDLDRERQEREYDRARAVLGTDEFRQEWNRGRAMTLDDACDFALAL
ncbi:MAG: tetratricopeptide repeat protein [Chlorobia bacterium]|nr:tetratricopeptide repeat protein [Fimbriimonadaceae bacterium]